MSRQRPLLSGQRSSHCSNSDDLSYHKQPEPSDASLPALIPNICIEDIYVEQETLILLNVSHLKLSLHHDNVKSLPVRNDL